MAVTLLRTTSESIVVEGFGRSRVPPLLTTLVSVVSRRPLSIHPVMKPTTSPMPWTSGVVVGRPSPRHPIGLVSLVASKYRIPVDAVFVRLHPPAICPMIGLEGALTALRLPPATYDIPKGDTVLPPGNDDRRPDRGRGRPRRTIEKMAARLIRIRRRKMKKHKLRKLRKRMFHVFVKARQRREVRKEKIFQDELLAQMSRADEFDARAWVHEFLRKATTDPQTLVPKKIKRTRPTRYEFD